jgi:hypothetical protein
VALKKLVVILLLVVYGVSSSGMTIQFHYCCGKLKSVQLSTVTEKQCGMKHSMFSKPCCSDKQVELKLKGDQKTEQAKFGFFAPVQMNKPELSLNVRSVVSQTIVPEIYAPPPLTHSLYTFHCVYRI